VPQVFSFAHIRKPTAVADLPHPNEFLSKEIRGGYDAIGFADLGKKSQTLVPEFIIEARLGKDLWVMRLAAEVGSRDLPTWSRKSINICASQAAGRPQISEIDPTKLAPGDHPERGTASTIFYSAFQ
jgi:hypothetical protein